MRGPGPSALRQQALQRDFDFLRIVRVDQAQPLRDPCDMGVNHHPGDSEAIAQNDVGRLPPDALQSDQLFHGPGHFPAEPADQGLAGLDKAPGLRLVESSRSNLLLQSGRARLRVVLGRLKLGKEPLRHLVHPLIRALGRQDGRHQQLERCLVVKSHLGAGKLFIQQL